MVHWLKILQIVGRITSIVCTFANSFDPDQARQNVGPDLDRNWFDTDCIPERIFEKINLGKKQS